MNNQITPISKIIDIGLLTEFSDLIHKDSYVFFRYRNNNNKNQLNLITSAMDWIHVSSEYLLNFELTNLDKMSSMELYSYISSIDIIVEAITQLHRVFYNTKSIPFKNEKVIFKQNIFNEADNIYFKTIRSCFGAHPVNLKNGDSKERKRFASWSSATSSQNYDYSVIIYSNQLNENDFELGISIAELNAFLQRYFLHIEEICTEIHRQHCSYVEKLKKKKMPRDRIYLKQLFILKDETAERLCSEHYINVIDILIVIFSAKISNLNNRQKVEKYKIALHSLIHELYNNLQSMQLGDLKNECLLEHPYEYHFSKLSEYVLTHNSSIPHFSTDLIKRKFSNNFTFDNNESPEELYVLFLTGFNYEMK